MTLPPKCGTAMVDADSDTMNVELVRRNFAIVTMYIPEGTIVFVTDSFTAPYTTCYILAYKEPHCSCGISLPPYFVVVRQSMQRWSMYCPETRERVTKEYPPIPIVKKNREEKVVQEAYKVHLEVCKQPTTGGIVWNDGDN